jgi:hypothetical protein
MDMLTPQYIVNPIYRKKRQKSSSVNRTADANEDLTASAYHQPIYGASLTHSSD